ncbi:MAG: hypothetical protein WC405_04015 [Syntrophales bacterium]
MERIKNRPVNLINQDLTKDMFRKKRQKAILTIAILPLYLFLFVFGVEGSLVCFGEDGHVAVEFVQSCNSRSADEELAGSAQDDACGPCADVHFLKNAASLKSTLQTANTFSTVQGLLPRIFVQPQHDPNDDSPILLLNPHTENLAKIQSVVLLI